MAKKKRSSIPNITEKLDLGYRERSRSLAIAKGFVLLRSLNPNALAKPQFQFFSHIRYFPLLLTFLLIPFISGCKCSKDHEYDEKNPFMKLATDQIIKINIQGEPSSLHPHTGIDLKSRSVQKSLFEGMTRLNPGGKPELAIAEKVSISPNRLIYTFTLRPSLWSNGQPVTAYHFENAWKKGIAAGSNCLRADLFYPIKLAFEAKKGLVGLEDVGVKAVDENTLIVELEHPTPYFLELLSLPLYAPLYDDEIEPVVFNGPFLVKSWEREKLLTLSKNPNYWESSVVKLSEISCTLVHDPNTALLMYEKGELDWMGNPFTHLAPDILPELEHDTKVGSKPVTGVYWFCCNTLSYPLNSVHIRKALSYSLNRNAIAEISSVETPSRTLVPLHMLPLHEDELYPDNNLKAAQEEFKKGLAELKVTKEQFPALTLSYSDIAGQKNLAEAVASEWEKNLGIKVELQGFEWNTFFNNLGTRQYQIGGCIWYYIFNDPIYPLEFFKEASHRYNASQWENLEFKKLLDLADGETDLEIRKEHLRQAELILLDEMPVIPVYISNYKYLVSDKVKDIAVLTNGLVDFKWSYVQK